MDWSEFQLARQLLLEERVGRPLRAERSAEDAEYDAALAAMTRG